MRGGNRIRAELYARRISYASDLVRLTDRGRVCEVKRESGRGQ